MKPEVVLCVDSESAQRPELIGLGGERLIAQTWLRVFCSAVEARKYLGDEQSVQEVWVASCDDMEPINLAAALKKDSGAKSVYLLAFGGGGSLKSRARAANLDATLSQRDLASRYAYRKARNCAVPDEERAGASVAQGPPAPAIDMPPAKTISHDRDGRRSVEQQVCVVAEGNTIGEPGLTLQKKPAFILSVVSASGGSGKSTVAVLSAWFSQGLGNRTLLVDADLQFGDLHYLSGMEDPLTLDEAVSSPLKLNGLSANGAAPALLAAPKRLEQSESVAGGLIGVLEQMSERFDVIVINTSSFWAEQHAQMLERSSCVLFLIDQRPSSLRTSRHALELCTRCGIATTPFVFAVNRCARNGLFTSLDVACSFGGVQTIELKDGGREVEELLGAGQPLELIETRNDLCLSLERALVDILPQGSRPDASRDNPGAPRAKRFRFGRRRRRAACL